MDPEIKQELTAIHALVKDNHDMLRAMRRNMWLGIIFKIVFWALVIVIPLYLAQQYLQPMAAKFAPSGTPATTKGPFGLPSTEEVKSLINLYSGGALGQ